MVSGGDDDEVARRYVARFRMKLVHVNEFQHTYDWHCHFAASRHSAATDATRATEGANADQGVAASSSMRSKPDRGADLAG